MSQNPLADLAEYAQKQSIENRIAQLQNEINTIKRSRNMPNLIELEIFQEQNLIKKISINPEYIISIKDDGIHSYISMTNNITLHAAESRETIVNLIKDSQGAKYIK